MNNILKTVLFVTYWSGFLSTLWVNSMGRFHLIPHGLPKSVSAALRQSVLNTLFTFVWFVSVPLWFIVRRTKRRGLTHDEP